MHLEAQGRQLLAVEIEAAVDEDAVIAMAMDAGFVITQEDMKAYQEADLSDQELEGGAGDGEILPAPDCRVMKGIVTNEGRCYAVKSCESFLGSLVL